MGAFRLEAESFTAEEDAFNQDVNSKNQQPENFDATSRSLASAAATTASTTSDDAPSAASESDKSNALATAAEALLQHQQAQLLQATAMQMHANQLMAAAWQHMYGHVMLSGAARTEHCLGGPRNASEQRPRLMPTSLPEPRYVSTASTSFSGSLGCPWARRQAGFGTSSPEKEMSSPVFVTATRTIDTSSQKAASGNLVAGESKHCKDHLSVIAAPAALAATETQLLVAQIGTYGVGSVEVPLKSLLPRIVEVAHDPIGSEHIVHLLKASRDDGAETDRVVAALTRDVAKLSWNQYGHIVIESLFEVANADQRRRLAMQFIGKVTALAKHKYGCWVLQQAFEKCPLDIQLTFAKELQSCVKSCIESMHGNHVVQKCVELLPSNSLGFILEVVEPDADRIAMHKYGCRVIQRLLEHCPVKLVEPMLERIVSMSVELSQDPFGNYVLRHLLEFGKTKEKRKIIHAVLTDFERLAADKHASTVVERCFAVCCGPPTSEGGGYAPTLQEEAKQLIDTILHGQGPAANPRGALSIQSPPFKRLVDDKFGNYVVQSMAKHVSWNKEHRERILHLTLDVEPRLRTTARGTKILAVLLRETRQ
jgi:hypothetical protein